jgi:hypothetical protein
MRNCEVATKDMVPTPATQGGHVPELSQMRELKDLTLPLMVKVGVGPHEDMTLLRG